MVFSRETGGIQNPLWSTGEPLRGSNLSVYLKTLRNKKLQVCNQVAPLIKIQVKIHGTVPIWGTDNQINSNARSCAVAPQWKVKYPVGATSQTPAHSARSDITQRPTPQNRISKCGPQLRVRRPAVAHKAKSDSSLWPTVQDVFQSGP